MPWANGLGSTEQIDVVPANATLAERNFLWRLSSATLHTSSPFSLFPGFRRWLMVTKGKGLFLNGLPLQTFEEFHFDGDQPIEAKITAGAVVDLGLIFNPAEVVLKTQRLSFTANSVTLQSLTGDIHYLCNLQGQCTVGTSEVQVVLNARDVLKLENISSQPTRHLEITSTTDCHLAVLSLRRKKI